MRSVEVIGSINRIYDRFDVPPNLRMHMYRVAAVAELICDNWKGPKLNRDDLVAACLLHDLGNIVKMDFESKSGLRMVGGESKNAEHWKGVKENHTRKYGNDAWQATIKMIAELGVDERIYSLVERSIITIKGDDTKDLELKILSYSDGRVGPFGVVSLKERYDDFAIRYKEYLKKAHSFDLQGAYEHACRIEKLIFGSTAITPEQINDRNVEPYVQRHLKGN